jgi:hypothetical protein
MGKEAAHGFSIEERLEGEKAVLEGVEDVVETHGVETVCIGEQLTLVFFVVPRDGAAGMAMAGAEGFSAARDAAAAMAGGIDEGTFRDHGKPFRAQKKPVACSG